MRSLSFSDRGDSLGGKIDRQSPALREIAAIRLQPARAARTGKEAFRYDNIRLCAGNSQRPFFELRPASTEQQHPIASAPLD